MWNIALRQINVCHFLQIYLKKYISFLWQRYLKLLVVKLLVNNIHATLKGNDSSYALAIWTDGEFAYSLSLSEGIEETEWIEILQTFPV